jgi:hypothetical protein
MGGPIGEALKGRHVSTLRSKARQMKKRLIDYGHPVPKGLTYITYEAALPYQSPLTPEYAASAPSNAPGPSTAPAVSSASAASGPPTASTASRISGASSASAVAVSNLQIQADNPALSDITNVYIAAHQTHKHQSSDITPCSKSRKRTQRTSSAIQSPRPSKIAKDGSSSMVLPKAPVGRGSICIGCRRLRAGNCDRNGPCGECVRSNQNCSHQVVWVDSTLEFHHVCPLPGCRKDFGPSATFFHRHYNTHLAELRA